MSLLNTAFFSIADLKLWFNTQTGAKTMLSDVPEIIPLRWTYIRDNLEFLLPTLKAQINKYVYPDQLNSQLTSFVNFVRTQRNNQNKNVNPLSNNLVLTEFYSVWDNIEVTSLPITLQERELLQNKITRVQNFIKTDFITIRNNVVAARDQIADQVGLSDASYNTTYSRSSTRALRDPKISDIDNMVMLQNIVVSIDLILANIGSLNTVNIDPFALARANANNPDITIRSNLSGKLVRMFFGESLEDLAFRYLNDPDRWIEIAIANGLKPPYIDEIGEAIPLIANGSGFQINIGATDSNGNLNIDKFYINQPVFLHSNTMLSPDQRIIINIRQIPVSGEIVLQLDGDVTLETYTTVDYAYIRVFTPDTINSNFLVMIPSTQSPNALPSQDVPFFLASKKEDERRAGVDLAINNSGDIVIMPSSDLQLSFGVANAVQAVQFKLMSERGQNVKHPTYGLPSVVGKKANAVKIKQILVSSINDMINADKRFDRIETLNVAISGNSASIQLMVRLAGSGSLVPLSFTVNVG